MKQQFTYVIVSKADAENNWAMLNHSTSLSWDQIKKSTDDLWLFKTKDRVPNIIFESYRWYTTEEILTELEDVKWE